MIDISGRTMLNAIAGNEIECERDERDERIMVMMIDLHPIFTISASPTPKVTRTAGNAVDILSDGVLVASVKADSSDDAEEIRLTLEHLLVAEGPASLLRA